MSHILRGVCESVGRRASDHIFLKDYSSPLTHPRGSRKLNRYSQAWQQKSSVHPESGHSIMSASSTGTEPSGHAWYAQNDSQHSYTSHGSSAHAVLKASGIGVLERG